MVGIGAGVILLMLGGVCFAVAAAPNTILLGKVFAKTGGTAFLVMGALAICQASYTAVWLIGAGAAVLSGCGFASYVLGKDNRR